MNHVLVFLQEFPDCVILVAFAMHTVHGAHCASGSQIGNSGVFPRQEARTKGSIWRTVNKCQQIYVSMLNCRCFHHHHAFGILPHYPIGPPAVLYKTSCGILLVLRSTVAIPNPDHQIKTNM